MIYTRTVCPLPPCHSHQIRQPNQQDYSCTLSITREIVKPTPTIYKTTPTFAHGKVVVTLLALVALFSLESVVTDAIARMVAGLANGASPVAATGNTLWKVEVSGRTVTAFESTIVELALALAVLVARILCRPFRIAVTFFAVWVAKVARSALATGWAIVASLTETLATPRVTDVFGGAYAITLTELTTWVVVVTDTALVTLPTAVIGLTDALPRGSITVVVHRVIRIALTALTIGKTIEVGTATFTKCSAIA